VKGRGEESGIRCHVSGARVRGEESGVKCEESGIRCQGREVQGSGARYQRSGGERA